MRSEQLNFRMRYLGLAHVKANAAIHKIGLAYLEGFFYPVNALEPHEFNVAGCIFDLGYQSPASSFTHGAHAGEFAGNLDIFRIRSDQVDWTDLGAVNMPVGIMFQQIPERKNIKFFFEQVCALRAYAFEVFYGIG